MKKTERYKLEVEAFRRHLKSRSKKDILHRIENIRKAGYGKGPTIKEYFDSFGNSFAYLNNIRKEIPYKRLSSCLRELSIEPGFRFYKPPSEVENALKEKIKGTVDTVPFLFGVSPIPLMY